MSDSAAIIAEQAFIGILVVLFAPLLGVTAAMWVRRVWRERRRPSVDDTPTAPTALSASVGPDARLFEPTVDELLAMIRESSSGRPHEANVLCRLGWCGITPHLRADGWLLWLATCSRHCGGTYLVAWHPDTPGLFGLSTHLPAFAGLPDWVIKTGLTRDRLEGDDPTVVHARTAMTLFMDYARTAHKIGELK